MTRPQPRFRAALAVATALVLTLAACDDEPDPPPAPTSTATTTATPTIAAAPSASAATATRTPGSPTATATPSGGTSGAAAPAGYAQSCAAGHPWGATVRTVFVCLEAPAAGATVTRGQQLVVRGYAGGSFENNVVVELHDAAGAVIARQPLTYTAPDLGMPGAFEVRLPVIVGIPLGPARIVAYFTSPRDGATVALASADVRIAN